MKIVFLVFILMQTTTIFNFTKKCEIHRWMITNDVVMGGVSNSKLQLDDSGNGVFSGKVSTENNGGFAMTRLLVDVNCKDKQNILLRVKGDGKTYQFRVKSDNKKRFWYVQDFKTTSDWQTITLPLSDFYPSFRGNILQIDNFSANNMEEIAILIGNKRTEHFKLLLDSIELQ